MAQQLKKCRAAAGKHTVFFGDSKGTAGKVPAEVSWYTSCVRPTCSACGAASRIWLAARIVKVM